MYKRQGLDQIEASREAEPLMRKLLNVVLTSPEMAGRTEREICLLYTSRCV